MPSHFLRKILVVFWGALLVIAVMAAGPVLRIAYDSSVQASDWRTASREPMGWAPDPATHPEAVVQAYCARTVRWRGAFADHCWLAMKPAGAASYQRYEVTGFALRRGASTSVRVTETTTPDQRWFGAETQLIQDIRGPEAEAIVAKLPAAVASYPYAGSYVMWPGPNSNTFVAYLARTIPELRLALPGKAIGKDYTGWEIVTMAPSGTGFQLSLGGVFGLMLAQDEGFEVNVLGLVIGADPGDFAFTVPGVGRLPGRADWTNAKYAAPAAQQADAGEP